MSRAERSASSGVAVAVLPHEGVAQALPGVEAARTGDEDGARLRLRSRPVARVEVDLHEGQRRPRGRRLDLLGALEIGDGLRELALARWLIGGAEQDRLEQIAEARAPRDGGPRGPPPSARRRRSGPRRLASFRTRASACVRSASGTWPASSCDRGGVAPTGSAQARRRRRRRRSRHGSRGGRRRLARDRRVPALRCARSQSREPTAPASTSSAAIKPMARPLMPLRGGGAARRRTGGRRRGGGRARRARLRHDHAAARTGRLRDCRLATTGAVHGRIHGANGNSRDDLP